MLWEAIVRCCDQIDISTEKMELALKLTALLLENNFVEVSDGIYRLGGQLAMGCSSSGDALDTVALWHEARTIYGLPEYTVTIQFKEEVILINRGPENEDCVRLSSKLYAFLKSTGTMEC